MIGACAQICEFFRAHVPLPAQAGNHNWPGLHDFLTLFIVKWDGPASKLVEPFHRIDQVTEECVSPHLPVRQRVQAGPELEGNRFIDSAVLYSLEFRIRELARRVIFTSFLEVGRAQQAANNVASIHAALLSDFNPTNSDVGDVRKYITYARMNERCGKFPRLTEKRSEGATRRGLRSLLCQLPSSTEEFNGPFNRFSNRPDRRYELEQ